jgi:hypothetical protein
MSKSDLKEAKSLKTTQFKRDSGQWWKINGVQSSIFRHHQKLIKFNSQSLLF